MATYINNNNPSGYQTTAKNGLKRFTGSSTATVNNYICLGDSKTSGACSSGTEYRIIGIVSSDTTGTSLTDNMVKVVKTSSVGSYRWDGGNSNTSGLVTSDTYTNYNSSTKAPTWEASCLNSWGSSCAGTAYSLNASSSSFLSSINFADKIASVKWHCYKGTTIPTTSNVTSYELASNACSTSRKIGLIYGTDYLLSYNNGSSSPSSSRVPWLNFLSGAWTISNYGYTSYSSRYFWFAWYISNYAIAYHSGSNASQKDYYFYKYSSTYTAGTKAVYPTFYLNANVYYASGSGTSTDPYRIM